MKKEFSGSDIVVIAVVAAVCLAALALFALIPADSLNINLVYKGF